ncbi:type I secretion system permease/ATPase [Temperatibacter marinus]|uniref:Type I secretion system permease/ATPase n=1 Tax=Temperatibacter marinus TaxID=1456591 RepID=A0AA52EIA1_9PROT|nr:type I secretion system permease/ATPase [Temperatibacter marinus]WND03042.1 type I secretion system permease/ATPase [Temperatibacter marinus]
MSLFKSWSKESERLVTRARKIVVRVILFSAIVNLLFLVSPIYMLQLYDRVMSNGSVETLIALTGIALLLLIIFGALDSIRNRMLVHFGVELDAITREDTFKIAVGDAARGSQAGQIVRDLDTVRQFIGSNAPLIFFDAPWAPLFILVIALIHPLLGLFALVGALLILLLAIATDRLSKPLMEEAAKHGALANNFFDTSLRNAAVLQSMNLADGIKSNWTHDRDPSVMLQGAANGRVGLLLGITKALRLGLQIGMLGLGGYLAIQQQITAGAIVAGSILAGRAFAPVEQAIGVWRQIVKANAAYRRMRARLDELADLEEHLDLPRPDSRLSVKSLVAGKSGHDAILKGITFDIPTRSTLGIIGPSGAGKTYLSNYLIGTVKPTRGAVRLGGVEVTQFNNQQKGELIGYLPQSVELFPGTVAQNIARFSEVEDAHIIRAAERAQCHDLILAFPEGYQTKIGPGGLVVSGGQAQRIALARALFGDPLLVVLDEPDSNLDTVGEQELVKVIQLLRHEDICTVLISHNVRLMQMTTHMLVLHEGQVRQFDTTEAVIKQFSKVAPEIKDTPLKGEVE